MNKFAIKPVSQPAIQQPCSNNSNNVEKLCNNDEIKSMTAEQYQIYNNIYSTVSNTGSIRLSDKVGKIEQLLYLIYDLKGEDRFLDIMFNDPTETFLNQARSNLDITPETKEIVRKFLHSYLYGHLVTYNYKQLESIAISLDENI